MPTFHGRLLMLMRVPNYTVIVLHPERFAWSQIHHASNETSEVCRGMSFTISRMFEIEMFTILVLRSRFNVNGKHVHDFLFDGDSTVFRICHHFQYINTVVVHDINLDL